MKLLDWLASFRLRLLFRGAFLLLALALAAMAVGVLQDEKQRSHDHYRAGAVKTMEQIMARLRHPSGQLALLNPELGSQDQQAGRPVVLPFSALDFDDQNKVRNAVEVAGCLSGPGAATAGAVAGAAADEGLAAAGSSGRAPASPWCVAIGNTPWMGGFLYAVGHLNSPALVAHAMGDERLDGAHRLRVTLHTPEQTVRWLAPFERLPATAVGSQRGRFTGYVEQPSGNYKGQKPVREFRGWAWQKLSCEGGDAPADPTTAAGREPGEAAAHGCPHATFVSLRLPVQAWQEALFQKSRPAWPPADLDRVRVRIELLPPGDGAALFDSDAAPASAPFSLHSLSALLLPGETLTITRDGKPWAALQGQLAQAPASPMLLRLIAWLPVAGQPGAATLQPVEVADGIDTPAGRFQVSFWGDARSVNRSLGEVATRLSWFVGAMLVAVGLAWLVMEVGLIRPLARLTRRTRGLSRTVHDDGGLARYNLADLRGRDEMGLLASALDDLLHRVREDATRERLRAEQEKDMWHAVGHEIMSPLQSLLALHGSDSDPSHRYIQRMQQAVRVLYGSARPSEAFESTHLTLGSVDLSQFVRHVADNAGVAHLVCQAPAEPVWVRADEYSLEDVFSHILKNAERHRTPGTPIALTLHTTDTTATVGIHNVGPAIAPELLARMFEYGVSGQPVNAATESRGQGLFVVKTYLAKMGGTVSVSHVDAGVRFDLVLQRSRA